ncbi:MgtC/SapB family protein, partial [uncultured Phenylobacterium sp.]|uniref:MgtC/SapB family protein n=1 Tax=uncultured Phenylobacterium sp. TaxID=349273 RepID=UPI0025D0C864
MTSTPERLAVALAIGLLVGVERGWRTRDIAEGGRTAGIRTYALAGLLGGLAGALADALGAWAFATLGLPFAAAFTWFKARETAEGHDHSVTAIVAALLVFALGAYAVLGDWRVASGAAVVVTGLLAFKDVLHGWLEKLTSEELRSALVLLAMSLVALPLLPDRGFGPYGAFNPHELWLLTILLAGVSFGAYALVKMLGPSRGLVAASLAGALVSSTAVTLNLARVARGSPEQVRLAAGCALSAGGVMALRILGVAAVLAPTLAQRLAPVLGAFALVSAVAGVLTIGRAGWTTAPSGWPTRSPFDFGLVVRLAVVLGLVMAGARAISAAYGSEGLLPLSALAGLVDVDAVVLAVSRMAANEGLDESLAVKAILLAAVVDSLSKAVIASTLGGRLFGGLFALGTIVAAAAAAALA